MSTEPTMPIEQVDEIVNFLMSTGNREGLILANKLNDAMGRSARRRKTLILPIGTRVIVHPRRRIARVVEGEAGKIRGFYPGTIHCYDVALDSDHNAFFERRELEVADVEAQAAQG
jgi:hypothetical protein